MKKLILICTFLACALSVRSTLAVGLIIIDDSHWTPGPEPMPRPPLIRPWPPQPRHYAFAPLEINKVEVKTRIQDQVAVTAIDQEFYNPNSARLEGNFVFPIPKGAHIDKFSMEIDGKMVQAELLSAQKARQIYEDIVRKMKDPALLEYAGRDIFKVRIFPIEPHSHKRITLSYTQLLKQDSGLVSYSFPLSTEKFAAKPIKSVSVKVDLETARPLKSIYSPSHALEIKRHGAHKATAGYEASDVQPDTDFALYFSPEKEELGMNLLTHREGDSGYFLLLASPGVDTKETQVVQKDIAFVLDTSGSMAGKKLEQAKKALQFCVENLNSGDRFEILRFSTEVEPLFDGLVDASKHNREKADAFIRELKPIGATAIDDALKKALELRPGTSRARDKDVEEDESDRKRGGRSDDGNRPYVIIFLTDGRPTIGVTDEEAIVSRAKQHGAGRVRIFCFGIGTDVNTHLLDKITEETRGFSQYVLPEEDLEVKVSTFFSKIKEPVLANPTLKFSGGAQVSKLYPSPLPDLFKGEQLVLVGRYTGKGDEAMVVEGRVNGARKKFTCEGRFPESSDENEFIPRLWATRRVGYLLDEIRLHGENSELREEVTDLARKYGIVTPYTAYLIVEDESSHNVSMRSRSLSTLNDDSQARQAAAQNWSDFKMERGGDKAVAGARYGLNLKQAQVVPNANASAAPESRLALGLPTGPITSAASPAGSQAQDGRERLYQYSQQSQFAGRQNILPQ